MEPKANMHAEIRIDDLKHALKYLLEITPCFTNILVSQTEALKSLSATIHQQSQQIKSLEEQLALVVIVAETEISDSE